MSNFSEELHSTSNNYWKGLRHSIMNMSADDMNKPHFCYSNKGRDNYPFQEHKEIEVSEQDKLSNLDEQDYLKDNNYSKFSHAGNLQFQQTDTELKKCVEHHNIEYSDYSEASGVNTKYISDSPKAAMQTGEIAPETTPVPLPRHTKKNKKKQGASSEAFPTTEKLKDSSRDNEEAENMEPMEIVSRSENSFRESRESVSNLEEKRLNTRQIIKRGRGNKYDNEYEVEKVNKQKEFATGSENVNRQVSFTDRNYNQYKQNDADNHGNLAKICITCEKVITKDASLHKMHQIEDINTGINILQVSLSERLQAIQQKIAGAITELNESYNATMVCKKFMFEPLQALFKHQGRLYSENIHKLSTVDRNVKKLLNGANVQSFIQLIDLQNQSQRLGAEGETLLQNLERQPFWLISIWFKATLGLMLHSGKNVYATNDKDQTKVAPVSLQGDRILFSCFRKLKFNIDDDCVMLPFYCVSKVFMKEETCTFMKITYGTEEKGIVVLRIDPGTFWGRQFLLLCTGEHGPSYLDSIFFRKCLKSNQFGCHIWGGDYNSQNGSGGDAVLNDNSPLVYNPRPIHKGLISARFGYEDRSTIFRIFLSGAEDKLSGGSGQGAYAVQDSYRNRQDSYVNRQDRYENTGYAQWQDRDGGKISHGSWQGNYGRQGNYSSSQTSYESKAGNYSSSQTSYESKEKTPMDKFAFGNIEEGLDVLCHISDLKDITQATISDVGRILLLS